MAHRKLSGATCIVDPELLENRIIDFFEELDELMLENGFSFSRLGVRERSVYEEWIAFDRHVYEKNGSSVDIALKLELDSMGNVARVLDIIVYDPDNALPDKLYEEIHELYKKYFGKPNE